MVRVEGTQTIPAEWADGYLGTLTRLMPTGVVRKRYPFHIKLMQENGYKVSEKQRAQRERFKEGMKKFRETGVAQRTRWYGAMPQWHSVLWYYNYFVMSAVSGVAGAASKAIMAVKSIQVKAEEIETTGEWITFDTPINPKKAVVFFEGAAHNETTTTEGTDVLAFAWNVYPVFDSLGSSSVFVDWSEIPLAGKIVTMQIIEYV